MAAPAPATPAAGASSALRNVPGCPLQYAVPAVSMQTGTDPLLVKQWHLNNDATVAGQAGQDLRAFSAWTSTRGENVRVAVIDDGIEVTHRDLMPNVVAGSSYSYRRATRASAWPLPCTAEDSHGTAVAGLITARDVNGIGVAGVAPRASLVGYNALVTSNDADLADALGRDLAQNAVYNNSWGSDDDGQLHPVAASFLAAIDNGIATGRNGKGAIYVFPSGNGGCYAKTAGTDGVERCVEDNSNYDGYVNRLGVITACAVDANGRQPLYGERGANILVCAPSSVEKPTANGVVADGITTTALKDEYRSDFNGTSASTPMVSGVVALMLSANPELTWRDVRLILAASARQNDFPALADPALDPGWSSQFGLHFSHKYGFGVADAAAAVALAKTWVSVGGRSSLERCGPYESRTVKAPLSGPSGVAGAPVPVAIAIDVPPCAIDKIEFVEVRLTADHPASEHLQVRLRSPRGLISELADPRAFCQDKEKRKVACGTYSDFAFGSVRHMGEPVNFSASNDWTLELADMVGGSAPAGTFDSWTITFYGRP